MAIPPLPPSSAPSGPVPDDDLPRGELPPEVAPTAPEPEPVAAVEPPTPAYPTPGYPTPGYPTPGHPTPQAPGSYPQQAYYAPGWSAPASGPGSAAAAVARRSHTRLYLGLAIGLLTALLIAGGTAWYLNWNQTRTLGEITGETDATARQVETGHCIADLPQDGSVGSVTLVPCSEPHDAQVLGTYALQYDDWPGQDVVDAEVAGSCELGSSQIDDGFRAVVWTPSEASWSQGDHRGVCIAWHPAGDVTTSFQDDCSGGSC